MLIDIKILTISIEIVLVFLDSLILIILYFFFNNINVFFFNNIAFVTLIL